MKRKYPTNGQEKSANRENDMDLISLQQYLGNFPYLKAMNLEMIAVNVFTHKKQGIVSDHLISLNEICKYLSKEMEKIIFPHIPIFLIDNISDCIISNDKTMITINDHRIKSFDPEKSTHLLTATESQIFNSF